MTTLALFFTSILPLIIVGVIIFAVVSSQRSNANRNNYMPPRNQNNYNQNPNLGAQGNQPGAANVCPFCGGQNAASDRFCGFCGSVLEVNQPRQQQNNYSVYPNNSQPNNYPPQRSGLPANNYARNSSAMPPNRPTAQNYQPRRKNGTGKALLIIFGFYFGIIAFFVICISAAVSSCSPRYNDEGHCDIYSSYNYTTLKFDNYTSNVDYSIGSDYYNYSNSYCRGDQQSASFKINSYDGTYLVVEKHFDSGSANAVFYLPDSTSARFNNNYSNYSPYSTKNYEHAVDTYLNSYSYISSYDLSSYNGEYVNIDFYFYGASGYIKLYMTTNSNHVNEYLENLHSGGNSYIEASQDSIIMENYTTKTSYYRDYNIGYNYYTKSNDEKTATFTPSSSYKYLTVAYKLTKGEANAIFYLKNNNLNAYDYSGNKYYGSTTFATQMYQNSTDYYSYYEYLYFDLSDYKNQEVSIDFYFNNASGSISFYLSNTASSPCYVVDNLISDLIQPEDKSTCNYEILSNLHAFELNNFSTSTNFVGYSGSYAGLGDATDVSTKINTITFVPNGILDSYLYVQNILTQGKASLVFYIYDESKSYVDFYGNKYYFTQIEVIEYTPKHSDYIDFNFGAYQGCTIAVDIYFENASGTFNIYQNACANTANPAELDLNTKYTVKFD